MDVDTEDAERNRAAEALSDLAHAAVTISSSSSGNTVGTSSSSLVNDLPRANEKQKKRPAALLTPTRRPAPPGKSAHLSPGAGPSSAAVRRSPLAAGETPVTGEMGGSAGLSPNGGEKGKGAFNSPFTTQPFVSRRVGARPRGAVLMLVQVAGVVHEAASTVPTINTGTRKDVPTYHVLRKEDGEMCTRTDLQVRLVAHASE